MPVSKKRKKPVVEKQESKDLTKSKASKILILILCVGMVLGILVAAIYLMIQAL